MALFQIDDKVVCTENAYYELSLPDGKAQYGRARKCLYRSRRGMWYVTHDFDYAEDGVRLDYAESVSAEEAARLILLEGADLPGFDELNAAADRVTG